MCCCPQSCKHARSSHVTLSVSQVSFRILLQPTVNFLEDVSSFQMSLSVNSSNQDSGHTQADNTVQFSLPVRVKTDLRIRG